MNVNVTEENCTIENDNKNLNIKDVFIHRYPQLDAMRGIACLMIVFGHYIEIWPRYDFYDFTKGDNNFFFINIIKYTPLHLFFASNEAVRFFFVLSGFVLFVSVKEFTLHSYKSFFIRRIFRIYVPFLAAITVGLILNVLLREPKITYLSEQFDVVWARSPNIFDIVKHVLFVVDFDADLSDPSAWSLRTEMRYSLIFPLIVLIVNKCSPIKSLLIGLTGSFAGSVIMKLLLLNGLTPENDYAATLLYCVEFFAGATLARNRVAAAEWTKKQAKIYGWGTIIFFTALAYTYSGWLLPGYKLIHFVSIENVVHTGASIMFICVGISSPSVAKLLTTAPFQFVGKLSYSIYLYHYLALLICVHLLHDYLPLPILLAMSLVLTAVLSMASWRLVEAPAIRAGKQLSARQTRAGTARVATD